MDNEISPIQASTRPTRRIYFPALDGLRFLAFILVLISHMPPVSGLFWPNSLFDTIITKLNQFGWIGVDIFLTLSSYLIVSLLLAENELTGSINIRDFYLRRIIRIWPVYYPYLLFAFFIYPYLKNFPILPVASHHLFPFMVFSGNFSYWLFVSDVPYYFAHLWTISLEEQFYVILPIMLIFLIRQNRPTVVGILLGLELFSIISRYYVVSNSISYPMLWVASPCRIDAFIIGGVAAFIERSEWKSYGYVPLICSCILFYWVMTHDQIQSGTITTVWQLGVVDLGAGLLLIGSLNTSLGKLCFGNPVSRYLGRISFGMYVFHEVCLQEVEQRALGLFPGHPARTWIFVLVLSLLLIITASTMSYFVWERPILRFKGRFEVVKSRPA